MPPAPQVARVDPQDYSRGQLLGSDDLVLGSFIHSSQPGVEPSTLAVKAQRLNHWTAREVCAAWFGGHSVHTINIC